MGVLKTIKRHAFLFPLYALMGAGCMGAVSYAARVALYNPDVQWKRQKNKISNEEYRNKQYKLYPLEPDVVKCPAPKY